MTKVNINATAAASPYAGIGHILPRNSRLMAVTTDQAFLPAASTVASDTQTPAHMEVDLSALYHRTPVVTLLAQVQDWTLAWAGRISCTLRTSIGDFVIHTNRDKLSPEVHNGSWIHAKLLLARAPGSWHTLMSATLVFPDDQEPKAAWLPVAAYAGKGYMQRLRLLLSNMEPSMQAVFMGVMSSASIQQGYFARFSAKDHHTYFGGLLHSSIQAAEIAFSSPNLSGRDKSTAALACLLFDLGKAKDPSVFADSSRVAMGLRPHPTSLRLASAVLSVVDGWDPEAVAQMRSLLEHDHIASGRTPGVVSPELKRCVIQSLIQSWQMDLDYAVNESSLQGGAQ